MDGLFTAITTLLDILFQGLFALGNESGME